jgi:hypothetical protein
MKGHGAMRLSAEVSNSGEGVEVHIYADQEGLDYLRQQFGHLGSTDHIHLFAPAWGGSDLTEEPPRSEAKPVHRFKIYLRPDGEERLPLAG